MEKFHAHIFIYGIKGLVKSLSIAAEHVDDLVTNEFGDGGSCRFEILTGIEVRGVLFEVLSEGSRHSHTQVGVDVDFANSHRSRLTEHFFGYTLRAGHVSAVFVDLIDEILRNAACAVQNDREFRQALADFFENVETKFGFAFELERILALDPDRCRRNLFR